MPGTRRIVVKELKEIHKGTDKRGRDYTIYQLIATTEGGAPITENLRSFQQLPKNQVIDVTIDRFEGGNGAVSYTVSTKAKGGDAVGKRVKELEERLDRQGAELKKLIDRVKRLEGANGAAPAGQAGSPAPQGAPPASPQPPPEPSVGPGSQMPTDDIPF